MLEVDRDSEATPVGPEPTLRVLLPAPIGPLALDLTGELITRVKIRPSDEECAGYVPFSQLAGSDFLDEIFGRLSEYFAGARRDLEIKFDLGPSGVTGLARRILKEAVKVPFGRTRTYGRIAEKVGRPDAYRVVLSTLVMNPLPILIPCHRIVTHKSGIGSYVADQEIKRWLIAMERQALSAEV
jgi:methylated-DNA-[protein]-cysteine S-methyltransferase